MVPTVVSIKGTMNILFIIGAPRSGTNMLRDILCSQDHILTWPCDEINYIWRVGRPVHSADSFDPQGLTSSQCSFIYRKFQQFYGHSSRHLSSPYQPILLEKTCANCLRINHLYSLFPSAKYIYLRRDPYDAIYSSMQRWSGGFNLNYILSKAYYIPKRDLYKYAASFLASRISQLFSASSVLSHWGPILDKMIMQPPGASLEEICTNQWFHCNYSASKSFSDETRFNSSNLSTISYEDLIDAPLSTLENSLNNLSIPFSAPTLSSSVHRIYSDSIGKGKRSLSPHQITAIQTTLQALRLTYR